VYIDFKDVKGFHKPKAVLDYSIQLVAGIDKDGNHVQWEEKLEPGAFPKWGVWPPKFHKDYPQGKLLEAPIPELVELHVASPAQGIEEEQGTMDVFKQKRNIEGK
jgi:hypothetical protein